MTITLLSVASTTGSSTTPAAPEPASISAGDFALACFGIGHSGTDSPTMTTPPGWTGVANNPHRFSTASWSHTTYFFYKVLTAGDVSGWDCSGTISPGSRSWSAGVSVLTSDAGDLAFDQETSQVNGGVDATIEYGAVASSVPANAASMCAAQWLGSFRTHNPTATPDVFTESYDMATTNNQAQQYRIGVTGAYAPGDSTLSGGTIRQNSCHITCYEVGGGATTRRYSLPVLGVG